MSKVKLCVGFLFFSSFMSSMHAQTPPPVVVFWEEGFPAADTVAPSRAELVSALPNARYASAQELGEALGREESRLLVLPLDRKSTRLNSSHGYISYAVFCLKKKKQPTSWSLGNGQVAITLPT